MYCEVNKQLKKYDTTILNGNIFDITENFLDNASVEVFEGEAIAA